MIIIIIILLLICCILSALLVMLNNQIKKINNDLEYNTANDKDRMITVQLINKNLEKLTHSINQLIESKNKSHADKVSILHQQKKLIANMSHDLRTPLTSILGYLQLIKMDACSDVEKTSYIISAERRAKVLEKLLNDFYELSVIDSIDYKLKQNKINLTNITQDMLLDRYEEFNEKNLEVTMNIDDNLCIIADEDAVRRVIENLISNTLKYAENFVNISLYIKDKSTVIEVQNGVSELSADEANLLFDRFYMADKTRSGKGTGLGLSIVKELMLKMNGTVHSAIDNDTLTIVCIFIN